MTKKRKRPSSVAADNISGSSNRIDQSKKGKASWKKLDVGLKSPSKAAPGIAPENADENYDIAFNHYDNPSSEMYRSAEKELEADPAQAVGIFYGLEVLDGSQYTVMEEEGRKKIVMFDSDSKTSDERDSNNQEGLEKDGVVTKAEGGSDSSSKKKEKKKRKKKKKKKKEEESSKETSEARDQSREKENPKVEKSEEQGKPSESNSTNRLTDEMGDNQQSGKDDEIEGKDKEEDNRIEDTKISSLQASWLTATGGVTLKDRLCRALLRQQFWTPTPIQAATLPAAILGRRNIVGAAPTGSGKTLAYLLPILDFLLDRKDNEDEQKVHALILCPTRELALQVRRECDKLIAGKCGTLIGGMATQKQERVLNRNRPPIIIATPGRLWDMLHSRDYDHLNDLSYLRFLVIDEADRMVQQGSFPQLHSILDMVQKANPMESDDEDEDAEAMADGLDHDDEPDRLLSLPGVRGEAKVVMLNDELLAHIERQKNGEPAPSQDNVEMEEEEFEKLYQEKEIELERDVDEDDISLPFRAPVQRQTFVYSATLTLSPSASYIASQNRKRKRISLKGVDGAIEEILDKARAKGKTKLVDLSNSKEEAKRNKRSLESKEKPKVQTSISTDAVPGSQKRAFNLPPGLKLQEVKCTQMHKDSHLYAYLMTTRQGAAGPCLIFCNSIACVRRVGNTLKELGLPVRILHAHMQQRSRFKSVESLQKMENRAVVVATDVAARGLDIPSVATVVHYDVARKVDDFVHRAGRTARGVGESAVGSSMSLISSAEDKAHKKIVSELGVTFEQVRLDGRLLASAQERTNLASKIIAVDEVETTARKKNQWFREQAEQAGLELDADVLDEGLAGGSQREQQQLREANLAKGLLRKLLAEPMVTQRYGKFLSHNSAAKEQEVSPYVVREQIKRSKKKRKKTKSG